MPARAGRAAGNLRKTVTGPPSISRKHPDWDKRLLKMLKNANRQIAVGFPRGEKSTSMRYPSGATILQVAIWNNYGAVVVPRTKKALFAPGMSHPVMRIVIPARPFMTQAVPRVIKVVNKTLRFIAKELKKRGVTLASLTSRNVDELAAILGQPQLKAPHQTGKELERLFRIVGQVAADELKMTITDGDYVANAPFTEKMKGSNHPLIDKGMMREAVTYVIR